MVLPVVAQAATPEEADTPQAAYEKLTSTSPVGDPTEQGQTPVNAVNTVAEATILMAPPPGPLSTFPQPFQQGDDMLAGVVSGLPGGGGGTPPPAKPQSDVGRDRLDTPNVIQANGAAVSTRLINEIPAQAPAQIRDNAPTGQSAILGVSQQVVDGFNDGANPFFAQSTGLTAPPTQMKAGEDAFATFIDQGAFGVVNGVITVAALVSDAAQSQTPPSPVAVQAAITAIPTALSDGGNAAIFAFNTPNTTPPNNPNSGSGFENFIMLTASGSVPGTADTCFFSSTDSTAGVEINFDKADDTYFRNNGSSNAATLTVQCGDKSAGTTKSLKLSTSAAAITSTVTGSIGGLTETFELFADDIGLASFAKSSYANGDNTIALTATFPKEGAAAKKGGVVAFVNTSALYVRVE
ncbi:MAG: hypothetical protein V4730_05795 [Pseudomonadota bacterium]